MTVVLCERSATPKLVFHTRSSFTSAERPSSCFVLVAFKELHKPSAPVLKVSVIVPHSRTSLVSITRVTCEHGSILTITCIKLWPVAFALHRSADGSATYSGIGRTLCDNAFWGSHKALTVGGSL